MPVDEGLPDISDGPDPWCTWCDVDVTPGPAYMIDGEDDGRWPPLFCSRSCASQWGNAAHQDRIYEVGEDQLEDLLEWVDENTDLPTVLSKGDEVGGSGP